MFGTPTAQQSTKEYFQAGGKRYDQYVIGNSKKRFIFQKKPESQPPEFKFHEIPEAAQMGQTCKAISLKGQDLWIGVDTVKLEDPDVDFKVFEDLKQFLENYFCQEGGEEEETKWVTSHSNGLQRDNSVRKNRSGSQEDQLGDVRTIPGGRYGCAQFVKICGPNSLRNLTLGQISQLVQYTVDKDIVRYHKTLIVWSRAVDKHKKSEDNKQEYDEEGARKEATKKAKLVIVKNSLIEILGEAKNGISLAQLPQNLNKKLPFRLDLNELGYTKLKELINDMQEAIKLELIGHNHPMAYLVTRGKYVHNHHKSEDIVFITKSKQLFNKQHHYSEDQRLKQMMFEDQNYQEALLTSFYMLMKEFPNGVALNDLQDKLSYKMQKPVDFLQLGFSCALEFVQKFIQPTVDIEILKISALDQNSFIVRPRQVVPFYPLQNQQYYEQQNQQFQQAQQQQSYYVPDHHSLYGRSTNGTFEPQVSAYNPSSEQDPTQEWNFQTPNSNLQSHSHNMSGPGPIKAQHQIFSDQFSRKPESKHPSYTKSGDFQGSGSMPFYPTYYGQGFGKSANPYSTPPSQNGLLPVKKAQGINSVDIKMGDVNLPYQGFYGSPVLLKPPKQESTPPKQKDASLDQSEENENSGIKETKKFLDDLLGESADPQKQEKL